MHLFKVVFFFIFISFSLNGYADNSCFTYLKPFDFAPTDSHYDHFTLLQKLNSFKNPDEFLASLDPTIKSTQVRIHTSRSIHRAYPDFPRLIYTDDSDPNQTLVYAFSLRQDMSTVLEMHSFNHHTGKSSLFQANWDEYGKLQVAKNTRMCFNCHSGGRPLFTNISSRNLWPFSFEEDSVNAKTLEKKLSELNVRMQFQLLSDIEFKSEWLDLLNSAIYDDEFNFQKRFTKYKSNLTPLQIKDYYYNQREVFYSSVGYKVPFNEPLLSPDDERTLRILQVFYIANLSGFVDLLSLNVRPGNYELSSTALDGLKKWLSAIDPTVPKKRKWSIIDFLK